MTVLLDGNAILDRETLHETLATGLCLPPWYGRNLDALYDCLTDVQEETVVVLRDRAALEEHLDELTTEMSDMSKDAECREERDLVKRYVEKLRDML